MDDLRDLIEKDLEDVTFEGDLESIENKYHSYKRKVRIKRIILISLCLILLIGLPVDFSADILIEGYKSPVMSMLGKYNKPASTAIYSTEPTESISKNLLLYETKNTETTEKIKKKTETQSTVDTLINISTETSERITVATESETKEEPKIPKNTTTEATENIELIYSDYVYSVIDGNSAKILEYIGTKNSVNIPSEINGYTVTVIGKDSFMGSNITEVNIPEGITTLESNCFCNCIRLKSITLPSTLLHIGASAFRSTAISEVTIPENVEDIGSNAFARCENLETITLYEKILVIGTNALNANENVNIIVN